MIGHKSRFHSLTLPGGFERYGLLATVVTLPLRVIDSEVYSGVNVTITDVSVHRAEIARQRASGNVALVVDLVCFPLFAVVASLAGGIFIAMLISDQHLPHPINWRIVWSPLVNSGVGRDMLRCSFWCLFYHRISDLSC